MKKFTIRVRIESGYSSYRVDEENAKRVIEQIKYIQNSESGKAEYITFTTLVSSLIMVNMRKIISINVDVV